MSAETTPPRAPARTRPRARRTTADRLRDAVAALADHRAQIVDHAERPWASITFAGTRHTLALIFAGEEGVAAGERFVATLPDHEFALPGQLVADATVSAVDHRLVPSPRMAVRCELLLLDDA